MFVAFMWILGVVLVVEGFSRVKLWEFFKPPNPIVACISLVVAAIYCFIWALGWDTSEQICLSIIGILLLLIGCVTAPRTWSGVYLISLGLISIFIGMLPLYPPARFEHHVRELLLVPTDRLIHFVLIVILAWTIFKEWGAGVQGSVSPSPSFSPYPPPSQPPPATLFQYIRNKLTSRPGWALTLLVVLIVWLKVEPNIERLFDRMVNLKTPWFQFHLNQQESKTEYGEVLGYSTFIPLYKLFDNIPTAAAILQLKTIVFKAEIEPQYRNLSIDKKLDEFLNKECDSIKTNKEPKFNNSKEYCKFKNKIDSLRDFWIWASEKGLGDFILKASKILENNNNDAEVRVHSRCWVHELKTNFFPAKKNNLLILKCPEIFNNGHKKNDHIKKDSSLEVSENDRKNFKRIVYLWEILARLDNFNGNFYGSRKLVLEVLKSEDLKSVNSQRQLHCLVADLIASNEYGNSEQGIKENIKHSNECLKLGREIQADIPMRYKKIEVFFTKNPATHLHCEDPPREGVWLEYCTFRKEKGGHLDQVFKDWEQDAKKNLAFDFAQLGERERVARLYVRQLEKWMDKDNKRSPSLLDTIGFVKMRFHKDKSELREAMLLFKEAEKIIKEKWKDVSRNKTWALKNISNHKNQAIQMGALGKGAEDL